jgi:transaldolase
MLFQLQFSGERWQRLSGLGAHRQRPLWASTSTNNPAYRDTLYIDELIGSDTVNTLPESAVKAFEDHGCVARTGLTLEDNGGAGFHESFRHVLASLQAEAREFTPR